MGRMMSVSCQLKSPEIKLDYQETLMDQFQQFVGVPIEEMAQKVNYLTLNAAMRDALVKTVVPEVIKHKGIFGPQSSDQPTS